MASIRSALIRTCMESIQKQLEQLDHWLHIVPDHAVEAEAMQSPYATLSGAIEKLSKQFEVQQHTLHHIVDRLDILEGMPDQPYQNEPWLDSSSTHLQNEIIEPLEPIYMVHKTETLFEPSPVITAALPEVLPAALPVALSAALPVALSAALPEVLPAALPVALPAALPEVLPVALPESSNIVLPLVDKVELHVDVSSVQEEEEEEEEEQESLETIEFKGTSYYKDAEGFIYQIEEDDQPSETAIGFWKEKSKTIGFYKK